MRKTGIGIVAVAIMLAGQQPAAQTNTPLVLDNVEAWWNQLYGNGQEEGCHYQLQAVNAAWGVGGVFLDTEWVQGAAYPDSKRQWCHLFADLAEPEREGLKDAAKYYILTDEDDRVYDAAGWWAQLPGGYSSNNTLIPQLGRAMAIGYDNDQDGSNAPAEPGTTLDVLTVDLHTRAIDAFNALKSGPADPTPTPAVPLAFLLLLGAGLAVRGAFLRR